MATPKSNNKIDAATEAQESSSGATEQGNPLGSPHPHRGSDSTLITTSLPTSVGDVSAPAAQSPPTASTENIDAHNSPRQDGSGSNIWSDMTQAMGQYLPTPRTVDYGTQAGSGAPTTVVGSRTEEREIYSGHGAYLDRATAERHPPFLLPYAGLASPPDLPSVRDPQAASTGIAQHTTGFELRRSSDSRRFGGSSEASRQGPKHRRDSATSLPPSFSPEQYGHAEALEARIVTRGGPESLDQLAQVATAELEDERRGSGCSTRQLSNEETDRPSRGGDIPLAAPRVSRDTHRRGNARPQVPSIVVEPDPAGGPVDTPPNNGAGVLVPQPPAGLPAGPPTPPRPRSGIHSSWATRHIGTAICDACDRVAHPTIIQCTACSTQWCERCAEAGRARANRSYGQSGSGQYFIDSHHVLGDDIDWTKPPTKRQRRR